MDAVILRALTRAIKRELESMGAVTYKPLDEVFPQTVLDAPLSTVITSRRALVGAAEAGAITIVGGEYQKNKLAWTSDAGTLAEGDTVKLRGTSSDTILTDVVVTATINSVDYVFTITTKEICWLLDGEGELVLDGEGNPIEVECE